MRGDNQNNVILIADDDLFIRKVITSVLNGLADIIEVTDGADVAAVYEKHMPDIIFLDIHLPNLGGLELIPLIQKIDPEAFIVMVSSDSSTENAHKIKDLGARAFLSKPFDKARVRHVFNRCPTIKFVDL